jgi:hypothetical protein
MHGQGEGPCDRWAFLSKKFYVESERQTTDGRRAILELAREMPKCAHSTLESTSTNLPRQLAVVSGWQIRDYNGISKDLSGCLSILKISRKKRSLPAGGGKACSLGSAEALAAVAPVVPRT